MTGLEQIRACERRQFSVLSVPGLEGDLHQDLGRGAMAIELVGSLSGDEARDEFLAEVRTRFDAGEPVDFVADITRESELEQVLVAEFAVEEAAGRADSFRYVIVLREYTEPPEPPGFPGADFGLGVDLDLGLDVDLGLDLLDLPGLLGEVPEIGDLMAPVQGAAQGLNEALDSAAGLLDPLAGLFEG